MNDLVAFLNARLNEDEQELVKDPPVGLGYANLSARMHREIAATRAILAEHRKDGGFLAACVACSCEGALAATDCFAIVTWPCKTVRLLATVYRDDPGYDPAWEVT